jgi:flavin-dependent dehydrogenase
VNQVAVIGAGPAGLVVSRWLVAHGLAIVSPALTERDERYTG